MKESYLVLGSIHVSVYNKIPEARDQGDGSVNKVVAVEARGPEVGPQNHVEELEMERRTLILAVGKKTQVDRWSPLTSKANVKSVSKKSKMDGS